MSEQENLENNEATSALDDRYGDVVIDGVGGDEPPVDDEQDSSSVEPDEASEEEAATDEQDDEKQDDGEEQEGEDKTKNSFKNRIQTVTHQRDEEKQQRILAEQERDNLKEQLDYYKKLAELGQIDASDFDSLEEYEEAVAAQKNKAGDKPTDFNPAQARAQAVFENAQTVVLEAFEGAENKPDDFDEVVMDPKNTAITPDIVIALSVFDDADKLAYEISKNRREGQRIANLPPHLQVKALEKLSKKSAAKSAPVKKQSSAPAPINNGGGVRSGGKKTVQDAKSLEEYKKIRRSQGAQGVPGRF